MDLSYGKTLCLLTQFPASFVPWLEPYRVTMPLGMVSRSSMYLSMIAFFTSMAGRTDRGFSQADNQEKQHEAYGYVAGAGRSHCFQVVKEESLQLILFCGLN